MTTKARKPGRPRDKRVDRAIVEATLDMLEEEGLGSLSMEGIAERAGVSKATVYRRWDSKEALVLDSIIGVAEQVEMSFTDDIRADLMAILGHLATFLADARGGTVFPWLIGEVACGSELGRRYAEAVIRPKRALLSSRIEMAKLAGELRANLDVSIAVDMLLGPVMVRRLMGTLTGSDESWQAEIVDGLITAWRPT